MGMGRGRNLMQMEMRMETNEIVFSGDNLREVCLFMGLPKPTHAHELKARKLRKFRANLSDGNSFVVNEGCVVVQKGSKYEVKRNDTNKTAFTVCGGNGSGNGS